MQGDLDVTDARSNTFELEWPKGSGKLREFPEVDRAGWFPVAQARSKLLKGQRAFLDRLMAPPRVGGLDRRVMNRRAYVRRHADTAHTRRPIR